MQISISPIKGKRGAHLNRHFVQSVPSLWGDDARWAGPVDVQVRVTNTGKCYLVKGNISGEAQIACHRCLKPVTVPVTIEIEEEFFPVQGTTYDGPQLWDQHESDEPDPDEKLTFHGDTIDLTDVVNQYNVMALPAKTLCDDACAGICPSCGQDLNEGSCSCVFDDIDPRLASLKQLLSPND